MVGGIGGRVGRRIGGRIGGENWWEGWQENWRRLLELPRPFSISILYMIFFFFF